MTSQPIRGRGAASNATPRYEPRTTEAFDDGWGSLGAVLEEDGRPRTTITPEHSKSILSKNDSPDVPFRRSINPYKGCEHGCSYCFARPTHAYLGLSPGLDFETKIFSKPDAATLLRREFAKKKYEPQVIAVGANTDPYQPAERELGITREILEVMLEHRHPCALVTKSRGILRDLDVLAKLAEHDLVQVMISVTTLDDELARDLEPRAASPHARLDTIARLHDADVSVGVLAAPMIPSLNDVELEAILERSRDAGASQAGYVLLRLTQEVAGLFDDWLAAHRPDRREHVLSLLRQSHGGDLYRSQFGRRMGGNGPWAKMLGQRFEVATRKLGLNRERAPLRTDCFVRPLRAGENLSLF